MAYSSGTAALHGATAAAGLGPGDVVVTSPLSFMASANCARYVGATPALVDVDPATWNLDVRSVDPSVAAVVPVHYAGLPVDLAAMSRRPRVVIEDAAHALGASTPDGPVGNCARSDMCCFSLHPVKPITTAEGGIVTTNDDELADRLRRFRTHGIVRLPERGGWYYEIGELGFNYRMTDIHAALGVSQLTKLDRFVERRNEIADRYRTLSLTSPSSCRRRLPTATGTATTCSPCSWTGVARSSTGCGRPGSGPRCTTCRSTTTRSAPTSGSSRATSRRATGSTTGSSASRCIRR